MNRAVLASTIVVGLALAACGGDDGPRRIDTDGATSTLASGTNGFYIGYFGGAIERRDGSSGGVEARAELDDEVTGLAANSTTLYATIESTDTVVALDAETLAEVTRIEIASVGGKSVAVGPIAASDRAVVIGDFDNVIALDPATLDQLGRTDDLAGPVTAVTIGASWAYAVTSNGQLYRLDPADAGVLDDRDVPFGTVDECGLAAGATGVWVAASRAPALYDLESLDLVEYLDLGNALAVIGAGEDGALVRGSAAGRSAVFSIDGSGRVTGETAMPGGQCLARSGDSSHVWGREGNGLVRVSIG